MIHRKAALGVGLLALAGLGAVAVHAYSVKAATPAATATAASAQADSVPAVPAIVPSVETPAAGAVATPVATTGTRVVYRDRIVYRTAAPRTYVHTRSKKHSAEIIAGSALGGAGLGALVGGGKGALVGGLVGGAAGTVYDRTTHKKVVHE